MSAFSARLTGSTPVANVATKSCTASQQMLRSGQTSQTDIVIVVQINLEHRDFVEVGFGVVIDPFDQVLATSAIDGISHRARRVQGCENTAKSERSNQEGLSASHRAETPVRRQKRMVVVRDEGQETVQLETPNICIFEDHVGDVALVASRVRRLACWAHPILCSLLPLHVGL